MKKILTYLSLLSGIFLNNTNLYAYIEAGPNACLLSQGPGASASLVESELGHLVSLYDRASLEAGRQCRFMISFVSRSGTSDLSTASINLTRPLLFSGAPERVEGGISAGQIYGATFQGNEGVQYTLNAASAGDCPIKIKPDSRMIMHNMTILAVDRMRAICTNDTPPRPLYTALNSEGYVIGQLDSDRAQTVDIRNTVKILPAPMSGMGGSGGQGTGGMSGSGGMNMGGGGSGGMAGTGGMGTGGMSGAGGSGGMAGTGGMGTGGSTTSYDDLLTCDDISLASDNRTLNVEASFLPTSPNESMGAMYNANASNRIQVFTGACGSSTRQDVSASLTYRRDMNMMNTLHGSVTLMTPYTSGEGRYCFMAQRDDGVSCQIDYSVTSSASSTMAPSGSFTFRSGTNVTLDWTARNGRAYLSGGHFDGSHQINESAGTGSADDSPIVPTRYVLTVRGEDGRDYIFSNTYTPPASVDPTVDFDYSRNTAGPGFVLNWTVHNANTRTLSGPGLPEEAIAETSTRVVTQDGLYTITARGILNTLRKSLYISSITAPGSVGPAPECLLNRIDTATGADFTWTTPNATAVTFKKDGDSGTLSTSGTQSTAISVRNPLSGFVTYTLLATGANGQSCSVTTLVMARRSVASATTPDPDGDHICNIRLTDPAPNPAVCHYFGTNQAIDNCSDIPNPDQANADGDYLGDACETSADAGVFNFPQQPAAGDGGCSCNLSTASTVTLEDQLPLVWIAASILVLRVLKKKVATS